MHGDCSCTWDFGIPAATLLVGRASVLYQSKLARRIFPARMVTFSLGGMEATSAFSAVRLLRDLANQSSRTGGRSTSHLVSRGIIRILRAVRLLRKSRELSMLMLRAFGCRGGTWPRKFKQSDPCAAAHGICFSMRHKASLLLSAQSSGVWPASIFGYICEGGGPETISFSGLQRPRTS